MTLSLTPLILGLGAPEMVIILIIVLLLFGGSRLAGLGKSTGRALKEFKEETKGLSDKDKATDITPGPQVAPPPQVSGPQTGSTGQPPWPQTPPNNLADPAAPDARKDS
jgi:sec-independent protein translocase protein TatA